MNTELKNFFYPSSICIAGASTKEKSIGYELLNTIKKYNFRGKVFPVNPKADNILGYKCFHSIEEIKIQIDLAIVAVPKPFVEESIDQLLTKDVKSIVLITAGFKEIGPEGAEIEKRIVHKIKEAGARLVGPNCMGLINAMDQVKLNATFVAEEPHEGRSAFLSQSGALGAAVLNSLRETDIRFAHFISVGNKADVNENDFLRFWNEDENIDVITMYLESFVDGKNFIKPFLENEIKKPVIVLKAGKTKSGMKAASSHTGALSAEDNLVDSLLDQFGIIRANDLNEMFNTAKGFENFNLPKGNKIAVVTNAGGPAILAVDKLEAEGLTLTELSEETKSKLKEIVHPEGSVENPVDLLPGGTAEIYKRVNEIVLADDKVDAVISIFVEPVMVQPLEVVEGINSIESEKPVFQVVMPLPEFWNNYRENSKFKKPIFRNPEDPAEVIWNMLLFSDKRKMNMREKYSLKNNYDFTPGFLEQDEINRIAKDYSLPIIKDKILRFEELDSINDKYFPLVIKGINKNVSHKSELDAVKLNIKNKKELFEAAAEIKNNFEKNSLEAESFLVQPFVDAKHELIVGGFRDPSFGALILFGSGGKYVETIGDTSIKSAYLNDEDIEDLIFSTKVGTILKGVRGEKALNTDKLKSVIKSIARIMLENEEVAEIDLNPLIVSNDNELHAVDIRIKTGSLLTKVEDEL